MNTSRTNHSLPLGRPKRGVQSSDIERAADALLRAGERPTVEKIRSKLGTGSPNTINPLLDQWWQRLSQRLEAGPRALERLPEDVIHAAESLWLSCLDQARTRAQLSVSGEKAAMESKESEQAIRAEVLSLREQELKARLADRNRTISILESQTKAFASLFRKEQAKLAAEAQRIVALQGEIESLRKLLASLSIRTALKHHSVQQTVATQPKKITKKNKAKANKRLPSKTVRKKPQHPQARDKANRSARSRS